MAQTEYVEVVATSGSGVLLRADPPKGRFLQSPRRARAPHRRRRRLAARAHEEVAVWRERELGAARLHHPSSIRAWASQPPASRRPP
jgi:hypothetical protein